MRWNWPREVQYLHSCNCKDNCHSFVAGRALKHVNRFYDAHCTKTPVHKIFVGTLLTIFALHPNLLKLVPIKMTSQFCTPRGL